MTIPLRWRASDGIDVFVELIGGADGAAHQSVKTALKSGKGVVTANKALLAAHGVELAKIAEKSGAALAFEAAVGGGIPIIKTLREALAGNRLTRLYGILNGTCNFILTRMEEGMTYAAALKEAQSLGYAEADPAFDVDGRDTAHKLAILTCVAFGSEIDRDAIFVEGISDHRAGGHRRGGRARLPHQAPGRRAAHGERHRAARASDHGAARQRHRARLRRHQCRGGGRRFHRRGDAVRAGRRGQCHGVCGGRRHHRSGAWRARAAARTARGKPRAVPARAQMQAHEGGYYLRLKVRDRPGAFAAIAHRMAEAGISLDSIVQRNRPPGTAPKHLDDQAQPVTIITHSTTEQAVRGALEEIEAEGEVFGRPQLIRIEAL